MQNVVGVGETVTVFGRLVKHFAMASHCCHLCKAPVLTKHAVAIFSHATQQRKDKYFETRRPA